MVEHGVIISNVIANGGCPCPGHRGHRARSQRHGPALLLQRDRVRRRSCTRTSSSSGVAATASAARRPSRTWRLDRPRDPPIGGSGPTRFGNTRRAAEQRDQPASPLLRSARIAQAHCVQPPGIPRLLGQARQPHERRSLYRTRRCGVGRPHGPRRCCFGLNCERVRGQVAHACSGRAPGASTGDWLTLAPPPVPEARTSSSVMTAVRPGRASVLQLIAEEVAPQLLQG